MYEYCMRFLLTSLLNISSNLGMSPYVMANDQWLSLLSIILQICFFLKAQRLMWNWGRIQLAYSGVKNPQSQVSTSYFEKYLIKSKYESCGSGMWLCASQESPVHSFPPDKLAAPFLIPKFVCFYYVCGYILFNVFKLFYLIIIN